MTVMGKGNRSTVPGSILFQLSHTVPVSAGSVEVLAIAGCVLAGSLLTDRIDDYTAAQPLQKPLGSGYRS